MKRKLVTSALPYVNNVPHLGNLIQVLSADVYSRYCRLRGYDTLYICGTDEYGTATETRAQEEGKTPRELCDHYHAIHKDIYEWFSIAFDHFGRTSTPQQTEITQSLFLDLEKNGYIREHTIEQLYCTSCQRFLADRFVRGNCPSCGYDDARGDQCENCGKLLDPTELGEPRCLTCGATPEIRSTKHLYIDLPAILPKYEAWMKKASENGQWARNAMQVTLAWIRDGLQERAITRDLKWGIPVPKAGFEDKVFYVWFDAPIGYISITKCLADQCGIDWKAWWQDPDNVELFQFIGKDNIPFHTVIFPSTLIGSGREWTKLHHMSSTEYLNYENGKFSKSKGIGVFGNDAKESGIHSDIWRFYIYYNRPEKADAQFTWKDFQEKMNGELIGNLGNLVNRTLTFIRRYYDGTIPPAYSGTRADIVEVRDMLMKARIDARDKVGKNLEWANIRDAFREIFALSSIANKAFQDGEPWKTRTEDPEKAAALMHDLCYLIRDITIMLHPYMPYFADRVASFFGHTIWSGSIHCAANSGSVKNETGSLTWDTLCTDTGLDRVDSPEIIFKPMDNETMNAFRERFAGSQSERKERETMTQETAKEETPPVDPVAVFNEKIALKAAKIISISRHPDADKLYIEKLDDGSGNERTIVSGLVPYCTEEELLGKTVIVADNLKPRKMRGVESQGMLLAASCKQADETEILEVLDVSWAAPGTVIIPDGADPAAEKPAEISADVFFSVPLRVEKNNLMVGNTVLKAAGLPVRTGNVADGEVS